MSEPVEANLLMPNYAEDTLGLSLMVAVDRLCLQMKKKSEHMRCVLGMTIWGLK